MKIFGRKVFWGGAHLLGNARDLEQSGFLGALGSLSKLRPSKKKVVESGASSLDQIYQPQAVIWLLLEYALEVTGKPIVSPNDAFDLEISAAYGSLRRTAWI